MNDRKALAAEIDITPDVFAYYSRCLIPLQSEVRFVARQVEHPAHDATLAQIRDLAPEVVEFAASTYEFRKRHVPDSGEEVEFEARIWALIEALYWEIPRRRLALLAPEDRAIGSSNRALEGLPVAEDGLVELSGFTWDGARLMRNGHAFMLFAPKESPNAQYWYSSPLVEVARTVPVFARPDPLLHGTTEELAAVGYKMWRYGRLLDWDRIRALNEEEHGAWDPGWDCQGVYSTDYAWTPRGQEVHFRCEEVPAADRIEIAGSRYFHAIFDRAQDRFVHLDAAVRVYSNAEWIERIASRHVRLAGKAGRRHKVFRIDSPVTKETFANLCAQFFVWNSDVGRYFGADTSS